MTRYFEKISELFTSWYDGLSDRERRLLTLLSLSLVILCIIITIFVFFNSIRSKNILLTRNQEQLTQIRALEGEYLSAKEKHAREMDRIRNNTISLFTYIQSITSKLGLSVPGMTEQKRALGKSGAVEVSVKVAFTKLSIDKLTRLLELLESPENSSFVKVTRLKISKRHDDPELLDIQMTVSTYKST
jgi:hypothetical protein